MRACDLSVETFGGVCDLDRVVGVLSLLDLTPFDFNCVRNGEGLLIRVRLATAERTAALCVARLRALHCVVRADLDIAPLET